MGVRKHKVAHRRARANTGDVIGPKSAQAKIEPRWKKHFDRLLQLRSYLQSRQVSSASIARDEQPAFSMHYADAGTANYDRDFALAMLSAEQDALYEIEEALDRIRRGSYGVCELTGERIEASRLEAIPWTRFTAAAEKELEGQRALKRTQLGKLNAVAFEEHGEPSEAEESETTN